MLRSNICSLVYSMSLRRRIAARQPWHRRLRVLLLIGISAALHVWLLASIDSDIDVTAEHAQVQIQLQTRTQPPILRQPAHTLRGQPMSIPAQPAQPTAPAKPASPKQPAQPAEPATIARATAPRLLSTSPSPQSASTVRPTQSPRQPVKPASAASPSTPRLATPRPLANEGEQQWSSDPRERSYQQQIMAHLRQHLLAPVGLQGRVRLELHIRYSSIATHVQVIVSSGSRQLDDWAVRAVLAANPFPPLPDDLEEPFIFRPTLRIAVADRDRG